MKRRLWMLNLLLVALTVLVVYQMREEWQRAAERESAMLNQGPPAVMPIPIAPPPAVPPVTAAAYAVVSEQMLFSPDRNPTVVVPITPVQAKPMPPLPVAYGIVNMPQGALAILSEAAGRPQKIYSPGEQVGEFKIEAVNGEEIVLQWEGTQVRRKLFDLMAKAATPSQATAGERTEAPSPEGNTNGSDPKGPGVEMSAAARACVAGDDSAPGTVRDGWKKVVTESPFGKVCRWVPAQ